MGASYYDNDSLSGLIVAVLILLALAGALIWSAVYGVSYLNHQIHVDDAVQRFAQIAGTNKIEVVRHSNNNLLGGEPMDVTFELKVNGRPQSGHCNAGAFSDMVCRLYVQGGE